MGMRASKRSVREEDDWEFVLAGFLFKDGDGAVVVVAEHNL